MKVKLKKKLESYNSQKDKMIAKRGISLIVLVVTIIIMLILFTAILLTLATNTPIESAEEAKLRNDLQVIKERYQMAHSQAGIKYQGNLDLITEEDLKDVILDEYKPDFVALPEGPAYVGDDEYIKEIARDMGFIIGYPVKEMKILQVRLTPQETTIQVITAIEEGDSPLKNIEYMISEDGKDWETRISEEKSYVFTGLKSNTTYKVKIVAVDEKGNRVESKEYSVTTSKKEIVFDAGEVAIKEENQNGKEYVESTWTNKSLYIALTKEADSSVYVVTGANTVQSTSMPTIIGESGISKIRVTTTKEQIVKVREYEVKIDKNLPEIVSVQETNGKIVARVKDSLSGIIGYEITKEENPPSNLINVTNTTNEITVEKNITENGTYYVYVKDSAGNIANSSINVTGIDDRGPVINNITVTEPVTGIYKAGENIKIEVEFDEEINENNTRLKIKFGSGAEKEITGEVIANKIIYNYQIQTGDNGKLQVTGYEGEVSDKKGNKSNVSIKNTTGNSITADTKAPTNTAPGVEATTNSITVTLKQTDENGLAGKVYYSIYKEGSWSSWQESNIFTNLKQNNTYRVKTKVQDIVGNESESQEAQITTGEIPGGTSSIKIVPTPTNMTNQNVRVEITYSLQNGLIGEYRVVGNDKEVITDWTEYIEAFEVEKNGQVEARIKDTSGQIGKIATLQISNIDKLSPTTNAPTLANKTTNSVTITLNQQDTNATNEYASSGLDSTKTEYGIYKDNKWVWQKQNTFTNLTQNETYRFKTKVTDMVGNTTESEELEITLDLIPGGSDNITITSNPINLTNKNVNIEIEYKLVGNTIGEYRIVGNDGTEISTWKEYTTIFEVDKNVKVEARIKDTNGQTGEIVTKEITNIDKLEPTKTAPTLQNKTTNSVTITLNQQDANATNEYASSGLDSTKTEYGIYKDNKWVWQKQNTFTNLTQNEAYKFKTKVTDMVGNTAESEELEITLDLIPGGSDNITITTNPTTNTNQNVSVEIEYKLIENTVGEYRILSTSGLVITDWTNYIASFEVEKNVKIEARIKDVNGQAGQVVTKEIINIDKLAPTKAAPTVSSTINTIQVTLMQQDSEATEEYIKTGLDNTKTEYGIYKDNKWVWQKENIFTNLTQNTTYRVKTKATDMVGNVIESEEKEVKTAMIPGGSENIKIIPTPKTNTNQNVNIEIEYELIENTIGEYRILSTSGLVITNWTSYTTSFEVDKNVKIEARIKDTNGQVGTVVTMQVTNIDKLAPTKIAPTATATTNEITVTSRQEDSEATEEYIKTGLDNTKTEYGIYKDNKWVWQKENTFTNLTQNTTYKIKTKATDMVGNVAESEELEVATITLPGGSDNINIKTTPTTYTNQDVNVEITYKLITNTRGEYRIITKEGTEISTWKEYTVPFNVDKNYIVEARITNTNNQSGEIVTKELTNIDKIMPTTTAPTVTATTNGVTVTLRQSDTNETNEYASSGIDESKTEYGIYISGSWTWQKENTFTNLTQNTEYRIKTRVMDNAGNGYTESEESVIRTNEIPGGSTSIKINPTPITYTNQNVNVEITYSLIANTTGEYRILDNDGEEISTWEDYTAPFEVDKNVKVEARIKDNNNQTGEVVEKEITNIDKLEPTKAAPTVTSTTSSITLTLNQQDAMATNEYAMSGLDSTKTEYGIYKNYTWQWQKQNTFTNLTQNTTYRVKTRVVDNARNGYTESEEKRITTNKVPGGSTNITISQNPTEYTNGNVDVTITYNLIQNTVGEYRVLKKDGTVETEWTEYSGKITLEKNRKIEARIKDENNQVGETVIKEITNIDKLYPNNLSPNATSTTTTITVTSAQQDNPATDDYAQTGIDETKTQYGIYKNGSWSWQTSNTFTNLTQGTSYQVKTKVMDNAGNGYMESNSIYISTKTLPNPQTISINKSPSTWTNSSVSVTINGSASGYILQYSKDNSNWQTYLSTITVTNNNETIYARFYDPNSKEATSSVSTQVTNIDRLAPNKFTPQVSTGINTITVTANVTDANATATNGKSRIRGYKYLINGRSWTEETSSNVYTFSGLTAGTQYQITVKAIDNAGNEVTSYTVYETTQNIPGGNSNIYFSYSETNWTRNNVTVTITASTSQYTLQYSTNGSTWYNYSSYNKVTMSTNGTIYARLTDGNGNYGATATGEVQNIDKQNPWGSYTTSQYSDYVRIYLDLSDNLSGVNSSTIRCQTSQNVSKINNTTYDVTANGTYVFTFNDNANNQGTLSVSISSIEEKKLRIGDYVDYVPNGESSVSVEEISNRNDGIDEIISVEDLDWIVLDMKDNGMVELISDTQTTCKIQTINWMSFYNNGVYILNDTLNKLYKNSNVGATARSINIEDVIDKINPGYDYILSTDKEYYDKTFTYYTQFNIPEMLKYDSSAVIDGVIGNGSINGSSDQPFLINDTYSKFLNSIQVKINYFRLNSNTGNNMKVVETKESENDTTFYKRVLLDYNETQKGYFYATRCIMPDTFDTNFFAIGTFYGPPIYASGRSLDTQYYNETVNKGLRPIVTIPQDRIDLSVGNGVKGNEWGIK